MKFLRHACLLALVLVAGCESHDVVMVGLTQSAANEVLVLLREHHIDAKKEAEPSKKTPLFSIKVTNSDSVQALRLLVDHRLPKVERASLKDIYPPGSSGLIPTKGEEHAKFLMASQGEVEALLRIIPGIKDVRVVLSFDPPSDVAKAPAPKTASVVILYEKLREAHAPITDSEVKHLIASSINGLEVESVTVVQKPIIDGGQAAATSLIETAEIMPPRAANGDGKNLVWSMLILTILALALACYGVFRLFIQKRAQEVST